MPLENMVVYSRECICPALLGQSSKIHYDGREETHRSCQKHESVSLHDFLSIGRHLLGVSFIIRLKVKFMYRSNHTEHYRKKTYYRTCTKDDCISAQCILTGIYLLLFTNRGRSAFFSVSHCQGLFSVNGSVDNCISNCRCST
jgi:hypothetical protein